MFCSAIIPCWNEEQNLPRTIGAARRAIPGCEVIAACAESGDGTERIAAEQADRAMRCPQRQRARQMNEGASAAGGTVLLFLHADTILPLGAGEALRRAVERGAAGGGFARQFDSPSLFLRFSCLLAEARCRAFGWFLGDQAIFARGEVFRALGGFRDFDRFEDLDFARRMKASGPLATLRPPVVSSARRFEREGPLRRTMRDFALTLRYLNGDPDAARGGTKLNHAD